MSCDYLIEDMGGADQADIEQIHFVHNWLSKMDDSYHYFTACFLDFSKVFEQNRP